MHVPLQPADRSIVTEGGREIKKKFRKVTKYCRFELHDDAYKFQMSLLATKTDREE